MAETKKKIPEGFNLRRFFGEPFDMILRTGSEVAPDLIELVEKRRAMKRCDICGLPTQAPETQKRYVGAYICDFCRRELQAR